MGMTARGFLAASIGYGLIGLVAGLYMAILEDHSQMPAHAHIMVIGWVSFFLFALFYLHFGDRVSRRMTQLHFWLAQVSSPLLFAGLWLMHSGNDEFQPLAAVSAMAYALSFLMFAVLAWPVLRNST